MKRVSVEKSPFEFNETSASKFSRNISKSSQSREKTSYVSGKKRPSSIKPGQFTLKDLTVEERAKIGLLIQNLSEEKEKNDLLKNELETEKNQSKITKREFEERFQGILNNFKNLDSENSDNFEKAKKLENENEVLIKKNNDLEKEIAFLKIKLEESKVKEIKAQKERKNELQLSQQLNSIPQEFDIGSMGIINPPLKNRKLLEINEGKTLKILLNEKNNQKINIENFEFLIPSQVNEKKLEDVKIFNNLFNKKKSITNLNEPQKITPVIQSTKSNLTTQLLLKQKEILDKKKQLKQQKSPKKDIKTPDLNSDSDSEDSNFNYAIKSYKQKQIVDRKLNQNLVSNIKKENYILEDGFLNRFS